MSKKLLIAGNWKLNGEKKDISFIENLLKFHSKKLTKKVDILICPPFTLIDKFCQLTQRSNIEIGAQDCSENETGAYTGEVSAVMLNDLKASYCIVGHSERRLYHNENNNLLNKKILNIQKNNIKAILCIGESLSDRKKSKTLRVLGNDLKEYIFSDWQEILIDKGSITIYTQYGPIKNVPIKNQGSDFEKKQRTSPENSGLKEQIYL